MLTKLKTEDIQLSSMEVVLLHGKLSERVVNIGIIICTSRQDIQSLVKFQAVILVKLACVYSTACLDVDSSHWTTGWSLQLGTRVWQLLKIPLKKIWQIGYSATDGVAACLFIYVRHS